MDHGHVETVADLPTQSGRAVYPLDFLFSPEIMLGIESLAAKRVMLDPHKSSA
jgi:uncharacterized protein